MNNKPLASLSFDLDNKWSYMKTHGEAGWEEYPSYLDKLVPRVLDFLAARDLKITFFIVGKDAEREENHAQLKAIANAGHEIGNHSFNHEPWLHLYTEAEIENELARTEEHLHRVTGRKPTGFRGPGYSISNTVLEILSRRGYDYDCSTHPTFLGPLARAYYFMTAKLTPEEREQRSKLFGTISEGLRTNKPHTWNIAPGSQLVEIPVTTMPLFKIPIHFSYILFIAKFSPALAMTYFKFALRMCRMTGVEPSLLLHPLDFLVGDDVPELGFFPAMRMSLDRKMSIMNKSMDIIMQHYEVMPMGAYVAQAKAQVGPLVVPEFKTTTST